MKRFYVEKNSQSDFQAKDLLVKFRSVLRVSVSELRIFTRFDVDGVEKSDEKNVRLLLANGDVETCFDELPTDPTFKVITVVSKSQKHDEVAEDSQRRIALALGKPSSVKTASVFAYVGEDGAMAKIKNYLLDEFHFVEEDVKILNSDGKTVEKCDWEGLKKHLLQCASENKNADRDYFAEIKSVEINSQNPNIMAAYARYARLFEEQNVEQTQKLSLENLSNLLQRRVKKTKVREIEDDEDGTLFNLSFKVDDEKTEDYVVAVESKSQYQTTGCEKSCLGETIKDAVTGRTYPYQAVTIAQNGSLTVKDGDVADYKSSACARSVRAIERASDYAYETGVATTAAKEIFTPNVKDKRFEADIVLGCAPKSQVVRKKVKGGDVIILIDAKSDSVKDETRTKKLARFFKRGKDARPVIKEVIIDENGLAAAVCKISQSAKIDGTALKEVFGDDLVCTLKNRFDGDLLVAMRPYEVEAFLPLAEDENLRSTVIATVTEDGRFTVCDGEEKLVVESEKFDTDSEPCEKIAEINDVFTGYCKGTYSLSKVYLERNDFIGATKAELSRTEVCSQKGLSQSFDCTVGGGSTFASLGGKYNLTPSLVSAQKIPTDGEFDITSLISASSYPEMAKSSPFESAFNSVLTAVEKLVVTGVPREKIKVVVKNGFAQFGDDKAKFGKAFSTYLGSFYAESSLGVTPISQTLQNYVLTESDAETSNVTFAVAMQSSEKLVNNVFDEQCRVYRIPLARDEFGFPDVEAAARLFDAIHNNIKNGNVLHASVVEEGGAVSTVVKSCLGNGLGFSFNKPNAELFKTGLGDVILSCQEIKPFTEFGIEYIGQVEKGGSFEFGSKALSTFGATQAFCSPLEGTFKTIAVGRGMVENVRFKTNKEAKSQLEIAKPRVFIPVFAGTVGEYELIKKFRRAGAIPMPLVIKEGFSAMQENVGKIVETLQRCQIVVLPDGKFGFDGGNLVADYFKNPALAEEISNLIEQRDGLILGIGNGYDALMSLGLLDADKVCERETGAPVLANGTISSRITTFSKVKIVSTLSPWAFGLEVGQTLEVPVSRASCRLVATEEQQNAYVENGQIVAQYVDNDGFATMESPWNVDGSAFAVVGLTSPLGKVMGVSARIERANEGLYKNHGEEYDTQIIESGVKYYK